MAAEILVTGATGTVGRVLVRDLVHQGVEVRAGIHTPDKLDYIKMSGVEPARFDFTDNLTIDKALQGISTVVLVIPFAREQVEYTRRIVDRMRLFPDVKQVIKLSMLGADDEPGTKFTRWHREGEKYIEYSGIPFTFVRANSFMQNFMKYVQPSGNFIYMPLDNCKVSYIDVRDVAMVLAEITINRNQHLGKIYEITGPESLTMDTIAEILTRVTSNHIGYINISEETSRHAFESIGTPSWLVEGMLELYAMQRTNRCAIVTSDVEDITSSKGITFDRFAHDFSTIFRALVQLEHHTYLY